MSELLKEYEGTWEEMLTHSDEFVGQTVQIKIMSPSSTAIKRSPKQEQLLAALRELQETEWTLEEQAALDEFEAFRKEHPVVFRTIEDAA